MASLFGTSGIRGHAKDLTNQFVFDIGRAFAGFLDKYKQKGMVAVGMDTRESSPRIKKAFSLGIRKEGYEVVDMGIVPVPAMNFILMPSDMFVGSCMITGSHIKRHSNGMKFFAFNEEIMKKHEREIEEIYSKIKNRVKFGERKLRMGINDDARKGYMQMLRDLSDPPYRKWKVVVDVGNGCQTRIVPKVFKDLKLRVITINKSLKPKEFLSRDTENEGELRQLQEKVRKEGADFGVAFDADGDRAVFVDENGDFIPGDYTGTLIAKYMNSKVVVTPISTSQVIDTIGKRVVRTKVGSPYVIEKMKRHKAPFGFEPNGGGIFAENMMTRDGGATAIKILNLLSKSGKSMSELVATLPKFALYRTKVECPRKLNSTIISAAKKEFQGIKVEEVDGVKIWLDKSTWILFRPSMNAPEFRVFAEAQTKSTARMIGRDGIRFVKSFVK